MTSRLRSIKLCVSTKPLHMQTVVRRRWMATIGTIRDGAASHVAASDVEAYHRDGAVVLRNLLSPEQVEQLQKAIDWNLSNPGQLAGVASADTDPGEFLEDFCNWQRVPGYKELIFNSKMPQVAAELTGSSQVRLYHDHLLVKEPKTQQPTPWHQDLPFYNIEGDQNVSFWIPVDKVPIESTLEFIAGTHTGQWYLPVTFLTEQAKWFPEGSLPRVPDIDSTQDQHQVLRWELEPGDVVAFHMLTLHGSKGSVGRRRAFSVRYIGDDVVHAPRTWRTSPEFEGLASELPRGVEMDHPLFPVVYPAII